MGADGGARRIAGRSVAEAELARWPHRHPYSIRRVIFATVEDETPMQALSGWMRANCRGDWCLINVPGSDGFVCMRDESCLPRFAFAFG